MAMLDHMCQSCGMPMHDVDQRGGGISDNRFCVYCTDAAGELRSYQSVLNGMATFMAQSENIPLEKARTKSEAYMTHLPAWRDNRV